ncbi:hypothetical protein BBJ28_00001074 [Nothophytophthora sp. Chile5]|nr:hypothetical protein BBJ28_00001074 [Nothophytophthora sp. Chile5]
MVNPPYRAPADKGRCTSDTDVDAPSPQLAFPYDEQLGPLCVNSADLEYIRRLSEEGAGLGLNQHHRVTYLTKYRGARFLVCKRLQHEVIDEALDTHRFALDVKLAATLDHPRIVALVGVVWSRMYGLEALYEYMEGGNLRSYLADLDAREELRSWTSPTSWKVQIALDVAEALVYAHSFSPTLVHRDLTSRSVLLSPPPEPRARLDDFIVPSQASRGSSGMSTIGLSLREERWLAPEVITGSADYSSAGDVYALGVILSELDTHSLPYEDLQDGAMGTQSMTDVAILDLVGSGKLRPTFSLGCPVEVQQLAQLCLSFEASERPTAVQVVFALRALLVDQPRSSYVI